MNETENHKAASMDIVLLHLMICGCLLTGCSGDATVAPDEFTREFASALQRADTSLKVEVVRDLEVKVRTKDRGEFTSYLENAYATYKMNPSAKDEVIRQHVIAGIQTAAASQRPFDKNRIVPVVKDRGWLDDIRKSLTKRGAKQVPENVVERLNDELVIVYAEDSSEKIRYLVPEDLVKNDLEKKDLKDLACNNLDRILPKIQRHGSDGLYTLTAGGDYEASLILLDSIWTSGQIAVQGEIVVAVPTRDRLIVTGSQDAEGLTKVREMVNEAAKEDPYRLSTKLFVRRNGRFEVFGE